MAYEIKAHITGTVWKIEKQVGSSVAEGETILILESMKMEMPVESTVSGTLQKMLVAEAQAVNEGDVLCLVEP